MPKEHHDCSLGAPCPKRAKDCRQKEPRWATEFGLNCQPVDVFRQGKSRDSIPPHGIRDTRQAASFAILSRKSEAGRGDGRAFLFLVSVLEATCLCMLLEGVQDL